jgi:hypothetical protein
MTNFESWSASKLRIGGMDAVARRMESVAAVGMR